MYQRMTIALCILTFTVFAVTGSSSQENDILVDRVSAEMLDPIPPVSTIDMELRKVKPVGRPIVPPFESADRLGDFIPGPTLPPPPYPGLNGLPFAPEGLSACDELSFYRQQWGLPAIFDGMGWRESNCRNDVENSCCHGWFQLHEKYWSHVPDCGVYNIYDLQGTEPIKKQRNACVAKHVYDISGCGAWSTCPF